jgi:hypothetical protein
MKVIDPDAPRPFLGLFTFHDQEFYGKAEAIQFYGVEWVQSTFSLEKGEKFAVALLDFRTKSIKLYDFIDDHHPKKVVDFELSIMANFYFKED